MAGVGDPALHEALAASQRLGMLGTRPIPDVLEHALAFVAPLTDVSGTVVDLGSGGGIPGLVLAAARPDLCVVLVDRRATRTDHLQRVVRRLGWANRVAVMTADAAALELSAAAAVARGFGSPAVTLSAAARLVRAGGVIVVSEPPDDDPSRWPPGLLAASGVVRAPWADHRVAVFDVPRET